MERPDRTRVAATRALIAGWLAGMCWPPPIAATVMALWVDVGDDVGWTQASVSSTADRSADAMTAGPELRGQRVVLRLVIAEHVPDLRRILGTPEVRCAGVMRPRPRSGPLTTCPPPGSPSCSTDRSAEWCSTARRRSRRTGTRDRHLSRSGCPPAGCRPRRHSHLGPLPRASR